MKIVKASNIGFCFGVRRAIDGANGLENAATLGELIHNDYVIRKLAENGVIAYDRVDDIPKDKTVIIRSHGEGKDMAKELEDKGYKYLDCTCPKVKAIQQIVHREHEAGKKIVIFGKKEHPEVIGLNGWCEGTAVITNDAQDVPKSGPIAVVSQTTENFENWERFKKEIENLDAEFYDTICDATAKRQEEAIRLAKECDAVAVIGSKKSSNTKKLYDV
ncbi:4-hydroxy-3-methylbut-2-enyl diphosphate reductase, partial [Treponema sp. R6D11]